MKVLKYFTRVSCGPCQSMKPLINELISQGYNIQRIDVDDNRELSQKYNISAVPTFILIDDGTEVQRKIGAQSKYTLIQMLG